MTPEALVALLEELIELKIQQHMEPNSKLTPELARLVTQKRETDRRRLLHVKSELVRFLQA
jgi:hypothetical protein